MFKVIVPAIASLLISNAAQADYVADCVVRNSLKVLTEVTIDYDKSTTCGSMCIYHTAIYQTKTEAYFFSIPFDLDYSQVSLSLAVPSGNGHTFVSRVSGDLSKTSLTFSNPPKGVEFTCIRRNLL
jgi:hypothetical protein